MSNSTSAAIIRHTSTISITFVEKPGDAQREKLKAAGYRYENGNWYKSQTHGQHADEAMIAKVIATAA